MPTIHFLREQLDVDCPAGAILRDAALEAGVQLYGLKGKLGNCGGCGQCSTCFVAVASPEEDACLTPRTAPEQRFLRRRPPSWRLACQAVVRESPLVVVTRPQSGWPGGDQALAAAASTMPAHTAAPPQDSDQGDGHGDGLAGDGHTGGDGGETVAEGGVESVAETADKTVAENGER